MTDWQVRTELPCKKGLSRLVSQWKLNLFINSLDNFNVHSKSKPYTHCKGILTNFDCTKWQYLLSAYYSTRLDRELMVQFLYFADCMITNWYHKLQKHNKRAAHVLLFFLSLPFRAPVLTACFKGSGKDPLPYLHIPSTELAGPSYSGSSFCTCNCSWSQCYLDISCWKSSSVQCYQLWLLMKWQCPLHFHFFNPLLAPPMKGTDTVTRITQQQHQTLMSILLTTAKRTPI